VRVLIIIYLKFETLKLVITISSRKYGICKQNTCVEKNK